MTDTPDIKGGDNSSTVAGAQLKAFLERIERLEEEKAALAGDIKEVYAEAKGSGFDTKAVKKLLKIQQDPAAYREQQSVLELYAQAIGVDVFS